MITAKKEFMYWRTNKEWYRINSEKDCFELTDKAPEGPEKVLNCIKNYKRAGKCD